MCTVTYIPSSTGYFLTSNRDEKHTRAHAIAPAKYNIGGADLIFPKDADAGGTWIVLKENGDSLCLLNGAFENFEAKESYGISRGKIVLNIAVSTNLIYAFMHIELLQTAPFTLIVVNDKKLFECRWDGEKKYCKALDKTATYIWSSATLYDASQQAKRENWFNTWKKNNSAVTQKEIFHFHKNTGDGNTENDLIMNRDNKYFTVSITGISVNNNDYLMQYNDIIKHDSSSTSFSYQRANS
jgi:hypothetical protein